MTDQDHDIKEQRRPGRYIGGIILLLVGTLFLCKNLNIGLPGWLFSWPVITLAIGLALGWKHKFAFRPWIFLVFIGAFFTIVKIADVDIDLARFFFPAIIIFMGLFLLFKPKSDADCLKGKRKRKRNQFPDAPSSHEASVQTPVTVLQEERVYGAAGTAETADKATSATTALDFIDSVNVFGGSHQNIFSKTFRGGEVVAVFGGCDINLSQADIQGVVVIDITAICGGVKLVVPASWEVKSEISAILGGLDDKRGLPAFTSGQQRTLVVRGLALCGGVEIKNF